MSFNKEIMEFITVEILKPLYVYEDFPCVRINSKYVIQAKKYNKMLKVTCEGHTHYMTYKECKSKWKKVFETFLFPDRPMEMREGYVVDNDPPKEPEKVTMDLSIRERLAKEFRAKYA